MTNPIGTDKIPSQVTEKPQRREGNHAQASSDPTAGNAAASPPRTAEATADLDLASRIYAQQEAPAQPALTLSDPDQAQELAQRLRDTLLANPGTALAAYGNLNRSTAEAALTAPAF